MADPIRQALERLQQYAAAHPEHDTAELVAAARATLAAERPAPAPADHVPDAGNMVAADGEAEELAQWLEDEAVYYEGLSTEASAKATRAAALLREARPQPVPGWQPIDTAPQDGTEILASDYDAIEIVMSRDCSPPTWRERGGARIYPAWWQPLPEHPPIPTESTTTETNG